MYGISRLSIWQIASRAVDKTRSCRHIVIPIISVLAGLLLWEIYVGTMPDYLFPTLLDIYGAYFDQIERYGLIPRFISSMAALVTGYVLGVLFGVGVGFVMGRNELVGELLNPYVNMFYVVPISALVPLIILVGGPTFESRVFVIFLFVVFEMIINTYQGSRRLPQPTVQVAKSFGAGRLFVFRNVVFPYSLPYIFAGLRLAIGNAIKGMILAELLIDFTNLGEVIRIWEGQYRVEGILSIVILLMALNVVLTYLISFAGDRYAPWKGDI